VLLAAALLVLAVTTLRQGSRSTAEGLPSKGVRPSPAGVTDKLPDAAPASFVLTRNFAIHSYPDALAVGDFNRDGNQDLAVLNGEAASVTLLFGRGNGDFGPRGDVRVPQNADSLGVADLNRDGKLDLIVGVEASQGKQGTISVRLGHGDGTFAARRTYGLGYGAGTRRVAALAIVDLNRDRRLDILTASGDRVRVLLGRGDGTFGARHAYVADAGGSITSFALGDLNGDGVKDVVAGSQEGVNQPTGALSVLLGRGNGALRAARTHATGFLIPDKLAAADLNRDGKRDLLSANTADVLDYDGGPNYCALVVSLGRGDSTFAQVAEYDFGSQGPSAFKVFDFNGDGDADLLVASVEGMYLLRGNGDGSFQAPVEFDATKRPGGALVAVADFDRDGKPELAVAGAGGDTLSIWSWRTAAQADGLAAANAGQGDRVPELGEALVGGWMKERLELLLCPRRLLPTRYVT
jgi:hypothetical protein